MTGGKRLAVADLPSKKRPDGYHSGAFPDLNAEISTSPGKLKR